VPARALLAALPDRDAPEFFDLLALEGHRRLSAALRVACAGEGFLQAKVGAPEAAVDPSTKRLRVTIPIDEGPRAIVARLEVPDAVGQAPPEHAPDLQLRAGAPFELKGYAADRARLLAWYRNEGYPDARIGGVLEAGSDGLAVRFLATPGPHVLVGTVKAARPVRTRQGLFDAAVVTPPGEEVRARDLDESRERLSETQAFRSVDVRLEPRAGDPAVRDVVVDVVERNGMNVEYGLRYVTGSEGDPGETPAESQAGFQVGAGVELISPFGWGHRYRVYGLQGAERRLLGARHDSATFFGRRWATQTSVFDDTSQVPDVSELAQRVVGATFQQTKRWRGESARLQDRLRMQWGYTFKWIEYIDLETRQSAGAYRAGLLHTLSGDSRDSLTDPRRGLFWSLGTEVALRVLGSDVDYVRTYGQLFLYTSFGPRLVWVQAYRAGVVPGENPLLLLENRFMAGGASTVRGFPESGLGPRTSDDFAVGGQAVVVFNQELRLPIWRRLWGGVFYDAGNVFALASDLDLRALRQSAGAGLRLMFPFGPVRFDWSAVIDPQEGERRSRWLFSIGHAF
jgi:outer membrane protein assembly factor BamA